MSGKISEKCATLSLPDIRNQCETLSVAERFFDSAILFALHDVGAFEALATGPKTLDHLHNRVGGELESLRALLDAAVATKILTKHESGYSAPAALLETLGRPESRAFIGEWVRFLHVLSRPLLEYADVIRFGKRPGSLFEAPSANTAPAQRMTAAMDAYARSRGAEMVERIDFSPTRTLLDLGCGPGTYSLEIVEKCPHVHAILVDLAGPIEEARHVATRRGMADRVQFVVADILSYEPAQHVDTVLISNVLHMLGPSSSRRLLARVYDMIVPGGRILVQAQYLDSSRTAPRWPTLLNLIQRVATPEGANHSVDDVIGWLTAAGFEGPQHVHLSAWNVNSVVYARRPST